MELLCSMVECIRWGWAVPGHPLPPTTQPLNAFLPPESVCRACGWSAALSFSCSKPPIGRQHKLWHLLSVKIQLIPEGRLNISEF